ncbi:MAG: methyltransferase domain-containing protein [Kofleriaceae bacterium]|nr:methyltransferase domain-containing protein [Kofleriaceae bacterium]MBP9172432.1 methyltransferase domain-containing protein [Kofleriaceae bacterium]MBP9860558.1 methyltransferase domain-containing protein [Kofleriaceae bacterium]
MAVEKRSLKQEKLARIYDDQIAPVWGSRFGKMLLRDLALPERGQILDISCGTGYPLVEVLRRKGEAARVIAIDASSAMLDIARKKVADLGALGKRGVFFRTESPLPRLSFADDVYDVVMCNLGLPEMPNAAAALVDFARVTKIGGEVRCTLPLAGTWGEFHDIYREVLVKHDRHDALDRLDAHLATYPTIDECRGWLVAAGLDPVVEVEEFTLLFKSSREFFFAPVVEYGPLPAWKAIAGAGQELQDVFWHIKESIDAYFGERAFQVTVKAGCLVGRKRDPAAAALAAVATPGGPLATPARLADGSVRPAEAGTAEVDILEMQEVEGSHNAVDVGELALDAFTDGKSRPRYLGRPRDTLPVHAGSVEPADADDSGAIDAAALITDEHDDGGHDDGGHDGGLYDHGADAPTSDALLATEHDDSDAPTGGVPRWDADDLEVDPVDAVEVDDDDLDTGDHLPPDRR